MRNSLRTILATLLALLVLAGSTAAATLNSYAPKHGHSCMPGYALRMKSGHKKHRKAFKRRKCVRSQRSSTKAVPLIGMGNVPGCIQGRSPVPALQKLGGSVLRVIVNPSVDPLICAEAAYVAGYRIELTVQWWNSMRIGKVKSLFKRVMGEYGPYVWAVSVGNEQEIAQGRSHGLSSRGYVTIWRAVEPIIARHAPQAIRVAGEITPWGFKYIRQALWAGLPGVQAIAAHPYPYVGRSRFNSRSFVEWSRAMGLQAWFTESLCGPGSWNKHGCLHLRQVKKMGVRVALEWHS